MTTKPEQCCDEPRGFVGGVCDHCGGEVQPEYFYWQRDWINECSTYARYKLKDTNFYAIVKFDGSFILCGEDDSRVDLQLAEYELSSDLDWFINVLTELREIAKQIIK